jgi:hypothetical protein
MVFGCSPSAVEVNKNKLIGRRYLFKTHHNNDNIILKSFKSTCKASSYLKVEFYKIFVYILLQANVLWWLFCTSYFRRIARR